MSVEEIADRDLNATVFADIVDAGTFGSFLDLLIEQLATERSPDLSLFLVRHCFAVVLQQQPELPPIATILMTGCQSVQFAEPTLTMTRRESRAPIPLAWYAADRHRALRAVEISAAMFTSAAFAYRAGDGRLAGLPFEETVKLQEQHLAELRKNLDKRS